MYCTIPSGTKYQVGRPDAVRSRQAVDEYFGAVQSAGGRAPMLTIVDYTGRMAVKG